MLIRIVFVLAFVAAGSALDISFFEHFFNGTVDESIIEQLAAAFNTGSPQKSIRKVIQNISDYTTRRKVTYKMKHLYKWEKLTSTLYEQTIDAVAPFLNETQLEMVQQHKEDADVKYAGNYPAIQKDTNAYILTLVPSDERDSVKAALDEPLKSFNTNDKLTKLKTALNFFNEKSGAANATKNN